jgi:polyhydroxybutyrate depolymerase
MAETTLCGTFALCRLAAATGSAALLLAMLGQPALACGRTTDCGLGERSYRIVLPESRAPDEPLGAIVFAHGYRGSAAGTMRSDALVGLAATQGLAFVAADAAGDDWQIPGVPSYPAADGMAELAYFDALRDDLIERFAVDPERIVAAGFSAGGMMTWHLACHRGDAFAGFVPLAGTFWAPLPDHCPTTAIDLIHYHGTADSIVPIEGRPIGEAHQSDVREAMALLTAAGGYSTVASEPAPDLDCTLHRNDADQRLELCLFEGGHELRIEHLVRALRLLGLAPED